MRTENRHLGYVGSSTCNLFDILNSFLSAYTYLGCWKDTARRAVPQIEGSDPRIRGSYRGRADAINKCYQVARQRKMIIFAVQNGGWCAAATNLNGYRKYGKAGNCRNGKGGPWANDVYRITNPIKPAVPKGRSTTALAYLGYDDSSDCFSSFSYPKSLQVIFGILTIRPNGIRLSRIRLSGILCSS